MTLKEDVQKPINLLFLVLTLVSIAVSFYFYLASKQEKRISISVDPKKTIIFDNKIKSPAFYLLDRFGQQIEDNVFSQELVIWNSGNVPIETSDVRIPLQIEIHNCKRIIDYIILNQGRKDVANFQLSMDSTSNHLLTLKWRHFDPQFGLRIQLIYAGTNEATVQLNGYVVGIDTFKEVEYITDRSWLKWLFSGMIVYAFVIMITFIRRSIKYNFGTKNILKDNIYFIVVIIFILLAWWMLISQTLPF